MDGIYPLNRAPHCFLALLGCIRCKWTVQRVGGKRVITSLRWDGTDWDGLGCDYEAVWGLYGLAVCCCGIAWARRGIVCHKSMTRQDMTWQHKARQCMVGYGMPW